MSTPEQGEPSDSLAASPAPCISECHNSIPTLLFHAQPDLNTEEFSLWTCPECGLVFMHPQPSLEGLLRFYAADYYGNGEAKFDQVTEGAVELFVRWRAHLLKGFLPAGGKVLDVGCGRGNFLARMESLGFDIYGTELTEDSAARSRNKFSERIFTGDLTSLNLKESSFDMITLWHVVEHLRAPQLALKEAWRLLKPGGRIVLAQPNIASFQAALGGTKWFHLDIPRHLFHFSPRSLRHLLEKMGFSVIRESQYSIEQNPFGLLQSFLNRLGLPQNHLYHLLKNEGFTVSLQARVGWMLSYYCLMPFAILLSGIESALGRGGSFYCVAEKKQL